MRMITDSIKQHKVLLPIYHNCYKFLKKQIHLGQTSLVETVSKIKNSSIWEISQFSSRVSSCCYGC